MGLEKTSRKKAYSSCFWGEADDKNKGTTELHSDGLESREMFFYREQGKERWVGSWSATDLLKLNLLQVKKGQSVKLYSKPD